MLEFLILSWKEALPGSRVRDFFVFPLTCNVSSLSNMLRGQTARDVLEQDAGSSLSVRISPGELEKSLRGETESLSDNPREAMWKEILGVSAFYYNAGRLSD